MKNFVILFRQGPRVPTADELALRQQQVAAWARSQNAAGHQLEPRILEPDVLPRSGGAGAEARPVTALLFLQAGDLAQAAEIAESHPATRFGATVEVRPWASPVAPAAAAR